MAAEEARQRREEEEVREEISLTELRKTRLEWKKKEETVEGSRSKRGSEWCVCVCLYSICYLMLCEYVM